MSPGSSLDRATAVVPSGGRATAVRSVSAAPCTGPHHGDMEPPRTGGPRLRRRTLLRGGLLAGTALAGAGCGVQLPGRPADPAASGPEPLQDVPGYLVVPIEPEPACKQTAVAYVQAVLTAGTPGTRVRPLESRLLEIRQPLEPAAPLLALLPPDGASSAVQVVYPQYTGLATPPTDAVVAVVAGQLVLPAGADPEQVERRDLTVSVRLRQQEGVWTVLEALPGVPPAPAPALTPAVQAVLDSDRVVLPIAAEADLRSGAVPDPLALALTRLAELWRLDVHVVRTGHQGGPGAYGVSNGHAESLAVDVRALDGIPVIDQDLCPWRAFMDAAVGTGASEVGGPQGAGRITYTDAAHQDHLHVGFVRELA